MTRPVIVNTRPRAQAAELSQRLRDAGFEPLECPAIEIAAVEPENLAPMLTRLRAGEYAWLVLPSRNSGRFFPELHTAPLLCGRATAEALGLRDAVTIDPFSARAALAWLTPRLQPGDRVLMPRAAEGRDELELGLRAIGIEVDAPICYQTQPASPASFSTLVARLRAGEVAAVTFCSPSAVRALSIDIDQARIVCLGQTTATAAVERGLRVDAVADGSTMAALVAAVWKALSGVPA